MKENQFRRQISKVLSANIALSRELQQLGIIASEILGAEYVANICNGAEIEFRPVGRDGIADDGLGPDNYATKYEEDIITIIRNNNGQTI